MARCLKADPVASARAPVTEAAKYEIGRRRRIGVAARAVAGRNTDAIVHPASRAWVDRKAVKRQRWRADVVAAAAAAAAAQLDRVGHSTAAAAASARATTSFASVYKRL
jgi:hypothetical protein